VGLVKNPATGEYRIKFQKEKNPPLYHPLLHVSFNLGSLLLMMIWNYFQVSEWNLQILLVLFVSFFLGNVTVWSLHRYPLHRRYKWFPFPYDEHTVEHHRYFTYDDITYTDMWDYRAIFFPRFIVAGFIIFVLPVFYFLALFLFNENVAHAFCGSAAGYFLLYELFHWASHLPHDHFVMKIRWIRSMREHHRIHHDTKLMNKYNFCIVYPLMDILCGTKYKGKYEIPTHND
jgi:hypothetical protein